MSEELDLMWAKITAELDALKAADEDLRVKTEKAGEAFSFPISTLAEAPLATNGMNTYAVRFISDWGLPTWYNPTANAWLPFSGVVEIVKPTILSGSVATIDIQNVPAIFSALKLILTLRTDRAGTSNDGIRIRFNNDSGNNYSYDQSRLNGATVTNDAANGVSAIIIVVGALGATATANWFGLQEVIIPDYVVATRPRFCHWHGHSRLTSTGRHNMLGGGIWENSANAINRITLLPEVGSNFVAGSGYALYGIGRAA